MLDLRCQHCSLFRAYKDTDWHFVMSGKSNLAVNIRA